MRYPRASGLLAHVTSLPGRYGIGDFGPAAFQFIDFLQRCGQSIWQVLPLAPTGYGNSPYQSLSAFAGNPLLVSLERLVEEGWLSVDELHPFPNFPEQQVDFDKVREWRLPRLAAAFAKFTAVASDDQRMEFAQFRSKQAWWLDEYGLFIALKEAHQEALWTHWQRDLVHRKVSALNDARQRFEARIDQEAFIQFQFARQWSALRSYAQSQGVRLMGDVPIFIAHDSADVWSLQSLFHLDEDGWPTVVAGVPPDYFSETGQLWGNPLYRWDVMKEEGFAWWIRRMGHALSMFDLVRLDHFRGFEAYWEIPADAPDASTGRWVRGPGSALFHALENALGKLPLIAEDLGVITPPVEMLRDELGFPGMRVLQFAFGSDAKATDYRPHHYVHHAVVYTGTHDNDTTVGWFHSDAGEGTTRSQEEVDRERSTAKAYFGTTGEHIEWDMIRAALASVADTAMIPMQDILGLGNEARMNLPGSAGGNWRWRFRWDQLSPALESRLHDLTTVYERLFPIQQPISPLRISNAEHSTTMVQRRDHL